MTDLREGQSIDGFVIQSLTPLPNLRAVALRARHERSGAELMHISCDDSENLFAVTFPTLPTNDRGLPHIMEHSVLAGSRRFPIREPFFQMIKTSMATFINAMTAEAYTVYPVSSNVKKDFFNLAEVYVDAVFHPQITESTFLREGRHFVPAEAGDPGRIKATGIVYNEMKGAYSSPESLVSRLSVRNLFPDTALGRDSGGDPDDIPDLTYDEFKQFYADHYHPSQALIFTYGNIPTTEHLRFLAPVLDEFQGKQKTQTWPRQPRWTEPRRFEAQYPIAATEASAARTFITLNWLMGDSMDPAYVMAWGALQRLILGNDTAPLKKAILDAKLGTDMFMGGPGSVAYEHAFHVGIKGTEPERAQDFERLVFDTLGQIAERGFPQTEVDAAFHQISYSTLEVARMFPMRMLGLSNASWPFGGDPLAFMRMDEQLTECRRRSQSDPGMWGQMIREHLLRNPHRTMVVVRPDAGEQARLDAEDARRMAARAAGFTPEKLAALAAEDAALQAQQNEAAAPEAVAILPHLSVGDLPRKTQHIKTEVTNISGITLLHNDLFANGISYIEFEVDLAGLPVELHAQLPRYRDAVNRLGAAGQTFAQIATRRSACTAELSCRISAKRHAADPNRSLRSLRFGVKTLDGTSGDALALLGDVLFSVNPRDTARMRDVLIRRVGSLRTELVMGGLGTATQHASRGLSPESAFQNVLKSPAALRRVTALLMNFDQQAEQLYTDIERIRDFVLSRARFTVSFTGGTDAHRTLVRTLEGWAARMGNEPITDAPMPFEPFGVPPREGLAGPMKVSHCVKAMPAPHLGHPEVPLFGLGLYLARFDYLLSEIRLKGNAYGAGATYDDVDCVLSLHSSRDPRIVETLDIFDGFRGYISGTEWTQADIDRAIIGSARDSVRPIRPAEGTALALARHVRGDTPELRESRHATLLSATPKAVKNALLAVLDAGEPRASVCVASGRTQLEAANVTLGARALQIEDIAR